MRSILALEDSLVQVLRHAMAIYDDDDDSILQRHISPSIHEQLSGNFNPLSMILTTSRNNCDTENDPPSPAHPSPTKCTQRLPALPPQMKEKRKASHGICWFFTFSPSFSLRTPGSHFTRRVSFSRTVLFSLRIMHTNFSHHTPAFTVRVWYFILRHRLMFG